MNARNAFSRRGWLAGAAVGLATLGSVVLTTCGQAGADRPTSTKRSSAAPQDAGQHELDQRAGSQDGAVRHADADVPWGEGPSPVQQTAGQQPAPSGAVLNELQKLYARDGREMPPMQMPQQSDQGPMQRQPQQQFAPPPPPQQQAMPSHRTHMPPAAGNRYLQPQQQEKRGFFSRLFGRFRLKKRPQPQQGRPTPSAQQQRPSHVTEQHHSPGLLPNFLRRLQPDPRVKRLETPHVARQPQRPAAQTPQLETPDVPEVPIIQERSAPVKTRVTAQDLGNPFPEGPESELKEQSGPFTGLTLDENENEEFQKPIIRPLPLDARPQTTETKTAESFPADAPSTTDGLDNPFDDLEETVDAAQQQPPLDLDTQMKLQKIAQRSNLKGLKGFCPVTLRDQRDLVDGSPEFSSVYNDQTYFFASAEAKAKFDADPAKYSPVKGGRDVISLAVHEEQPETGSLDHAVWYQNRLYLFSSVRSMQAFVLNPAHYAVTETEDAGPKFAK